MNEYCQYKQLKQNQWRCIQCGWVWEDRRGKATKGPIRQCGDPPSLADRICADLQQRTDVTRFPEDLDRIITICTTQCKRLGTGRWGEVRYEGCPRFGRPCTGAFKKWMTSIADAKTWCEPWGPEQGVFHDVDLTPPDPPDTMAPTHIDP